MKSMIRHIVLPISLCIVLLSGAIKAQQDSSAGTVGFAREILPVLSEKCFVCHGPDGRDKDVLRLDSFGAATRDLGGYRAIDPTFEFEWLRESGIQTGRDGQNRRASWSLMLRRKNKE